MTFWRRWFKQTPPSPEPPVIGSALFLLRLDDGAERVLRLEEKLIVPPSWLSPGITRFDLPKEYKGRRVIEILAVGGHDEDGFSCREGGDA